MQCFSNVYSQKFCLNADAKFNCLIMKWHDVMEELIRILSALLDNSIRKTTTHSGKEMIIHQLNRT